jgi:hypothetical protein
MTDFAHPPASLADVTASLHPRNPQNQNWVGALMDSLPCISRGRHAPPKPHKPPLKSCAQVPRPKPNSVKMPSRGVV